MHQVVSSDQKRPQICLSGNLTRFLTSFSPISLTTTNKIKMVNETKRKYLTDLNANPNFLYFVTAWVWKCSCRFYRPWTHPGWHKANILLLNTNKWTQNITLTNHKHSTVLFSAEASPRRSLIQRNPVRSKLKKNLLFEAMTCCNAASTVTTDDQDFAQQGLLLESTWINLQ